MPPPSVTAISPDRCAEFRRADRSGFTLIELLTVIAIVSILASLTFVGVKSAREQARSAKCIGNLRSIHLLANVYATENKAALLQNEFPAAVGSGFTSWQRYLYDYAKSSGLDYISLIRCPADQEVLVEPTATDTAANRRIILTDNDYPSYGLNQNLGHQDDRSLNRPTKIMDIQNPAKMIYIGDSWHKTTETQAGQSKYRRAAFINPYLGDPLFGRHNGRANVVFVDGHVQTFGGIEDPNGINSLDKTITGRSWLKK
jgi:prepilin-type N-terminal cleavage/methylation domain-containing protein/prepilin-type processing-associated H-X9-DG protein